jgi:hypothetical protein
VTLGGSWRRPAGDLIVERRYRSLSFLTPRGFSALARCASRSTHPDQNSGEVAVDLTWSDESIRTGMLPGKANVADECAGQPPLPAAGRDQPTPAVGRLRVARANRRPAERLLEEAKGMLNGLFTNDKILLVTASTPAPQVVAQSPPGSVAPHYRGR